MPKKVDILEGMHVVKWVFIEVFMILVAVIGFVLMYL